jgi:DNA ligase-1
MAMRRRLRKYSSGSRKLERPVMIEKPMLAAKVTDETLSKLQFPALVSPKIDGIRCIVHPSHGPVTRSFIPIPNVYIRDHLTYVCEKAPHLDGELIALDEYEGTPLTFNETQSAVMSHGGSPRYAYMVFDTFVEPDLPFQDRLADAYAFVRLIGRENIQVVNHEVCKDLEEFIKFTEVCVRQGFEGSMLRHPEGIYKNGRSTLNQGWLVKYKHWLDADGIIVGFEEKMHNANEDTKDKFGYAKRSSAKDGLQPTGTLGALVLNTDWGMLNVGSGFDDWTRQLIWNAQENYLGKTVEFKYQGYGMQDKPRFPIFLRFRGD